MPTQRKILTVVLLSASAGCGASAPKAPASSTTSASTATRVPTPEVAATPQVASEPVATVQLVSNPPAAPPAIAPDDKQPRELLELRATLYGTDELTIASAHARFRALCDDHGYPVVGNVASKSMRHDVSSYCEDVRTQLVMR